MAHRTRPVDADILRHLYVDEGLTIGTTASRLGIGTLIVRRELARHGIAQRTRRIEFSRGLIEQLYVKDRLSQVKIAKRLGVHPRIICREMRRHGIAVRAPLDAQGTIIDRRVLEDLYLTRRLSQRKIAAELGCGIRRVAAAIIQYGMPERRSR
jgi:Helix-turn-helix domain